MKVLKIELAGIEEVADPKDVPAPNAPIVWLGEEARVTGSSELVEWIQQAGMELKQYYELAMRQSEELYDLRSRFDAVT